MVKSRVIRALLCLLLIAAAPARAAVHATVDRNPVGLDETFTLVIETDSNDQVEPDLAPLREAFDLLGQSQSSTIQVINGRASTQRRWQLTLAPKQEGQVAIPAISVGREQTAPVPLTVTRAAPAKAGDAQLMLETSAEPREPYVQQQVVVTVRLLRSVNLAEGANLSEPALPGADAVIERLGEDTQYKTQRNGRQYLVFERRYALFPQKSGEFTLGPVTFDGRVLEPGRGGFMMDPFGQPARAARVRSEPVPLTVRPRPAAAGSGPWLPAREVKLVEQWSPEPPLFKVGEPVTRTLALMADGLTAAQLPPLSGEPPAGLKAYGDQPELRNSAAANGITGVRQEKVALVPTAAGRLTLPAVEVAWWNVATGKKEIARLPERVVEVAAVPGSAAATPTPAPQSLPAAAAPVQTPTAAPALVTTVSAGWWPWLSLLLACGWAATAAAWALRSWRRTGTPRTPAPAAGESERALRKQVEQACRANDPAAARTALLAWAGGQWRDAPPASLTALAGRLGAGEEHGRPAHDLAEELRTLDRALYAPGAAPWEAARLLAAFTRAHPQHRDRPAAGTALPPLWPAARGG